ncbi:major facilitator superfamily domain-containing protein [Suillus lakei]|nr:major facilitator superfamily domain-containing protein [Suillus lakei]
MTLTVLKIPHSWSLKRKWVVTAVVASFSFISPVSSSMIAPATEQVASTFRIDSDVMNALTTSIFVLAYAIGPLFVGPMSEVYGRSRVLQLANLWYLAWNLGCGFAQTESQLLTFRFLAGLGGSAPLSVGGGVLGDCWRPEERGRAFALYALAPMMGAVVGPPTGAWITDRSTWRWVFWSTCIIDATVQILALFGLQETYAPVLLRRKAERIRKSIGWRKSIVHRSPHHLRKSRSVESLFHHSNTVTFDDDVSSSWRHHYDQSTHSPFRTLFPRADRAGYSVCTCRMYTGYFISF